MPMSAVFAVLFAVFADLARILRCCVFVDYGACGDLGVQLLPGLL